MAWRIGVDIGGTFTDVALVDDASGRIGVAKVPTTPADLADGVLAALGTAMERYEVNGQAERTFSRLTTSAARLSAVSLSRLSWRHFTAGRLAAWGSAIDAQSGLPRIKETRNVL
jgi:hypothetical protein